MVKVGDLVCFSAKHEETMLRFPEWYGDKKSGVVVKVSPPDKRRGYNPGMVFFYTYYTVLWNDGEYSEHQIDELELLK